MSKNILALDQALVQSGWAFFNEKGELLQYGIISPEKRVKGDKRFVSIRDQWSYLFSSLNPDLICLEPPYGDECLDNKGGQTFSILNGVYWLVRELAARKGIEIVPISTATWQNRTGIHKRNREERKIGARNFAIKQFSLADNLEQDVYDACCIGWTYFYQQNFKEEKSAF